MTDERQTFTAEDVVQMIIFVGQFLREECQDFDFDEEDRENLAWRLVRWLLRDKTPTISPEWWTRRRGTTSPCPGHQAP